MNNISKISASGERHNMIEIAAYYRAEKRGFPDGDPVKDWLEAEGEIKASFKHPDETDSSKQERAAYQRMRVEFKRSWPVLRIRSTPTPSGRPSIGRAESSRNWGNLFPRRLTAPVKDLSRRWPLQLKKWVPGGTSFRRKATDCLRSGRTKGASSSTRPTLR